VLAKRDIGHYLTKCQIFSLNSSTSVSDASSISSMSAARERKLKMRAEGLVSCEYAIWHSCANLCSTMAVLGVETIWRRSGSALIGSDRTRAQSTLRPQPSIARNQAPATSRYTQGPAGGSEEPEAGCALRRREAEQRAPTERAQNAEAERAFLGVQPVKGGPPRDRATLVRKLIRV
jgi:hypothetical protein